jgi:hypothetical protein
MGGVNARKGATAKEAAEHLLQHFEGSVPTQLRSDRGATL